MILVAFPLVVILALCLYNYVLLPKMQARYDRQLDNALSNYGAQVAGKEDNTRQQLIENDNNIRPIACQVNDQPILAIISCQEKRVAKDALRQHALNIAGHALGSVTGIGVKEVDNTEHYFLVLTQDNLHYLHYSNAGKCKEHLSFSRDNMTQLEAGKITTEDALQNNAQPGETERFSFYSNDIRYKFFAYDKLFSFPGVKANTLDDMAPANYLFAKPFNDFVQQYRNA